MSQILESDGSISVVLRRENTFEANRRMDRFLRYLPKWNSIVIINSQSQGYMIIKADSFEVLRIKKKHDSWVSPTFLNTSFWKLQIHALVCIAPTPMGAPHGPSTEGSEEQRMLRGLVKVTGTCDSVTLGECRWIFINFPNCFTIWWTWTKKTT